MAGLLRNHWPEYLMEAAGLGLFMISAGLCATLLEHPGSPLHQALPSPVLRRALMGAAMGLTAVAIIHSPWGRRSGAHINPAVTLAFLRLGKVRPADAAFYIAFQCLGGLGGALLVAVLLGRRFTSPPIAAIATVPGAAGTAAAFAAELTMAFLLMGMVLVTTNRPGWERFTGAGAGLLVALFITAAAPLSGMSINPARTLASAVPSGLWTGAWIYAMAPPLGMLLAVEVYRRLPGRRPVRCAKLNHDSRSRCIFCGQPARRAPRLINQGGVHAHGPV
ncbi:MIP/aquaporin family protein [Azospirillum brasilense]|uniref:MIP/aquaporin family protein n=1 Tax=Azospirillum brasilense TaxID=192 RepID=UPI001EDC7431|nr:aquaporin [Azospirillum brasilense]UKJ76051.1 aquaporin [Azospirillum brasilense]